MNGHTASLDLRRPHGADLDALHALSSDPRVWTHFPSLRHTDIATTEQMVQQWIEDWARDGLGTWVLRRLGEPDVVGYGGCSQRGGGTFWNLGYRISADDHGQGYATEVAAEAVRQARLVDPTPPVVAYLVKHNIASARVARKVGLALQHQAPDAGNPDPDVMRLVYADRPLTQAQLAATLV